MLEEILFAGFGGQGIMYMGKLLAYAGMKKGYHVTWSSSYGMEVRGGTANCVVKLSNMQIAVPIVTKPNTFIAMNDLSLQKFKDNVQKDGLIVINSSTIDDISNIRKDIQIFSLPFADLALQAGDHRIANMVAIGAYIAHKKLMDLETVYQAMDEMTPVHRRNLLKFNMKALQNGYEALYVPVS